MWIFPLVGYAGVVLGFSFLTLAIASGLYYLSELVEEHTVLAKKLLTRLIYAIIATQILLAVIDRLPIFLSLLSIASHAVYAGNLRHFPIVKLSDPIFVLSCVLVITNHILWFRHFSTPPPPPPSYRSRYDVVDLPSFTDIASYFGICVWLVPFTLFVSLSAGENVLPSMGSEYATGDVSGMGGMGMGVGGAGGLGGIGGGNGKGRRKRGLMKAGMDWVGGWFGGGEGLGWRDKRGF